MPSVKTGKDKEQMHYPSVWTQYDTTDDPSKIGTGAIKYDKGKPCIYQGVIQYFPRALELVAEISTFGAQKYAWNGWSDVEDGENRYSDAQYRHALARARGEVFDPDSKKLHQGHEVWGALANLELALRRMEREEREGSTPDLPQAKPYSEGIVGG